MKKLLIIAALALGANSTNAQTCDYVVLSGTISSNTTLSASNKYLIRGCVNVNNGATLTIPAGTQLHGEKATGGLLIIEKNAMINAVGTSTNPIIFTSDQPVGTKAEGDWRGIAIAGNGTYNVSSIDIVKSCGTFAAGGANNADNSGILRYARIEFAGGLLSGDGTPAALLLAGVGSGTTIDHVQVSKSISDGIIYRGGAVQLNQIITNDVRRRDLLVQDGYQGKMQDVLLLRNNAGIFDAAGSRGVEVANNTVVPYTGSPITRPVFSNFTILGPGYCGSPIPPQMDHAVLLSKNAEAEFYNSVIAGYTNGFTIEDNSTINNANVNGTILASYNTFYANTNTYANNPANFDPTGTGCAPTIITWMDGTYPCSQIDNFERLSLTAYAANVCGNYCTTAPSFVLASINNLGSPDFSWDAGNDFNHVSYRGGMGASDWAGSWTNFCPQNTEYCPELLMKPTTGNSLRFVPNPARQDVAAVFSTDITGPAALTISDKVSGRLYRTVKAHIADKGTQQIAFKVSGLAEGMYMVRLTLSDGSVLSAPLSVQ